MVDWMADGVAGHAARMAVRRVGGWWSVGWWGGGLVDCLFGGQYVGWRGRFDIMCSSAHCICDGGSKDCCCLNASIARAYTVGVNYAATLNGMQIRALRKNLDG